MEALVEAFVEAALGQRCSNPYSYVITYCS